MQFKRKKKKKRGGDWWCKAFKYVDFEKVHASEVQIKH